MTGTFQGSIFQTLKKKPVNKISLLFVSHLHSKVCSSQPTESNQHFNYIIICVLAEAEAALIEAFFSSSTFIVKEAHI